MNEIFVDAGAWIAFLIPSEGLHEKTVRGFRQAELDNRGLVTTAPVLLEVLDGLAQHRLRHLGFLFRRQLAATPRLEIVQVDAPLFARGWDLYEARADKDWSLTDCLSFVVMERRGISEALAHDHHFAQAGFRALLR